MKVTKTEEDTKQALFEEYYDVINNNREVWVGIAAMMSVSDLGRELQALKGFSNFCKVRDKEVAQIFDLARVWCLFQDLQRIIEQAPVVIERMIYTSLEQKGNAS